MTITHRKNAGVRYHCDSCMKDVSDIPYVRCAQCDSFDLCVECFAAGVEIGGHASDHDYRVMDSLMFPVFDEDWGAEEELLLIEAIEKFGMGNWADIAEHVGGGRTKEDVEAHYYEVYVQSSRWPVPDESSEVDLNAPPLAKRPRTSDYASASEDVAANKKQAKPLTSAPCNHEIAGFMPGRGEFETDFGGEIDEMCVKELVFEGADSLDDERFKLLIMDIYNVKLDRKTDRKKLVLNNKLFEYKKLVASEKKRTREERDIINRVKVFARMQTPADFENFVNGLLYEQQLCEQIAALQNYRRQGITTLAGAQQFEIERARKAGVKPQPFPFDIPPPIIAQRSTAAPQPDSATVKPEASSPLLKKPGTPTPLDISEAEGVHLLTAAEQQICSQLRLLPKSYLVIKDAVLKEYAKLGSLRRRQCRALIKIDVNKTSRLYDFFLEMGWVRPPQRRRAASTTIVIEDSPPANPPSETA
ncbi:Transcriptional adapter ada2 [Sorochytrium milnesiophthora]